MDAGVDLNNPEEDVARGCPTEAQCGLSQRMPARRGPRRPGRPELDAVLGGPDRCDRLLPPLRWYQAPARASAPGAAPMTDPVPVASSTTGSTSPHLLG